MNARAEKLKALALETAVSLSLKEGTSPTPEQIAQITPIVDLACNALVKAFDILLHSPDQEEQIKHMVNRFLQWRLPDPWHPNCGIQFDPDAGKNLNPNNHRYEPVGTNLFDAGQAEAMVRFMIEGLPSK